MSNPGNTYVAADEQQQQQDENHQQQEALHCPDTEYLQNNQEEGGMLSQGSPQKDGGADDDQKVVGDMVKHHEVAICSAKDPNCSTSVDTSKVQKPGWIALFGAVMLIFFGIVEGFSMQASGFASPLAMRAQFIFKAWVILKVFLTAVGSSAVVQSIISLHNPELFDSTRAHLRASAGLKRIIPGAFVSGIGMALSGSGPTTVPSQIGAGVTYAGITLLGMLVGAVIYSFLEEKLEFRLDLCIRGSPTVLDKLLKIPYPVLAFPFGLCLVATAIILEVFLTQEEDAPEVGMGRVPYFLPIVCGLVIGFNQMPIRMISGNGQGGSTSVVQIVATVSRGFFAKRHVVTQVEKSYQFLLVWIGTTLGSMVAYFSIPHTERVEGYEWYYCLVGGVLMIIGARFANGCACGNGVSGVSELSWHAMIGAGCIFAGAIATTFVLDAAGAPMHF